MQQGPQWFVYILECDRRFLYTGIATDVERRLGEHRKGPPLGAKFMRGIQEIELVYSVEVDSRSLASKIEYRIKQLPRTDKNDIVAGNPSLEELMVLLKIQA